MFNTNPFREHRAKEEALELEEKKLVGGQKKLDKDGDGDLDKHDFAHMRKHAKKEGAVKEDPAHYAAIAKNNAAQQAKRDAADPEAAKKRKAAQAALDKKPAVKPADIGRHSSQFIGRRNEETMSIRDKLIASLSEGDRASHYKGATKPEGMHDQHKSSKGAMDMLNTPKKVEADGIEAAKVTAANAAAKAPGKKLRKGDNKSGDATIIPSATPVKDPAAKIQTQESVKLSTDAKLNNIMSAYAVVEDMNKVHTVDIDHETGNSGAHEKKHGVTLKKNKGHGDGHMSTNATGTKANLQKYLKKHYDGDHKELHPEIYK